MSPLPSSEGRLLATAEENLVRFADLHSGVLGPAAENALRQAFSLARLSLQAAPADQRALQPLQRAALALVLSSLGPTALVEPQNAGLLAENAHQLWVLALAARDATADSRAWNTALRQRALHLALGGGGGTGHVYLGCFAMLEAHQIRPRLIAGTSFGAILGLFRAQQLSFRADEAAAVLAGLTFKSLFRLFRARSRYVLPGPLRLDLRNSLGKAMAALRASREDDPPDELVFANLPIPLVVTVTGIRRGMLPRAPLEYERLLSLRSFFPPSPAKLQRRAQDLLTVLDELVRQPNRLEAVHFGLSPETRQLHPLDAIGLSCSLPGFIHYRIPSAATETHRQLNRLMNQREISWLADGGLVENCPAEAAHDALASGPGQVPRNGFVLALDAFSPKLTSPWWLPAQRLAHETVRRSMAFADLYLPFPRTLSPLSILPTASQIARAMGFGRSVLQPHMAFLSRLLAPLPALESSGAPPRRRDA